MDSWMNARTQRLPDLVAEQIRKAIDGGEFLPGARLPTEKDMAERFGVSRMVMREAMSCLRAEGVIETRQGVGAFVEADPGKAAFRLTPDATSADVENLRHIFQLRIAIEGTAARLAAIMAGEAELQKIAAALTILAADVQDGRDGTLSDQSFHASIAEASGNPYLSQFLSFLGANLREAIARARKNTALHHPHIIPAVEEEHSAVLAAIRNRDPEGAEAAMLHHLSCAMTRLGIGPFCLTQS